MLTIFGRASRYCDGVSRRDFLKIGAIGAGALASGMTLPRVLRAEAASGIRRSHKSVIMVYLPGGPSHQDMFDLKPDAPSEIRGEFRPIDTNVSGIQICEHMPRLAAMADKYAIIRSMVGSEGQHSSFQCLTGRVKKQMPPGGWPGIGSVLSKLQGAVDPTVPPFISLMGGDKRESTSGFLGVSQAPFEPSGKGRGDMVLNGVSLDRLADRKSLLSGLDQFRRDVDSSGMMEGADTFNREALDLLTSSTLANALDLKKEDSKVIERYKPQGKGDAKSLEPFLVARRLVEAGARCVTLSFGGWDTHGNNFKTLKERLPQLDIGLSALLTDLHDRGLEKDVSVVMWGEFGRTPKINPAAGRDHWPKVCSALLAGGGMKTGQVIGATDRQAGDVANRPISFAEVFATLYSNFGIDVSRVTLPDLGGRPQYLVENGAMPVSELVG